VGSIDPPSTPSDVEIASVNTFAFVGVDVVSDIIDTVTEAAGDAAVVASVTEAATSVEDDGGWNVGHGRGSALIFNLARQ
jgi:hypothetical protein